MTVPDRGGIPPSERESLAVIAYHLARIANALEAANQNRVAVSPCPHCGARVKPLTTLGTGPPVCPQCGEERPVGRP